MDEFFGLVAEQLGKKIREAQIAAKAEADARAMSPEKLAQLRAALEADAAKWAPSVAPPNAPAPLRRAPSPPRAPVATPQPPQQPAPQRRSARPATLDALPPLDAGLPTEIDGSRPVHDAAPRGLLAAFAGGNALLGALVLSEALAPPVALRPHEPPQ